MKTKRVVITGIGVVSPVGIGLENYWKALINGVNGVGYITAFDTTDYPVKIAAEVKNFNPEDYIEDKKKIKRMDKFVHYGMAAARLAIEDSNLNIASLDKYRIGSILGVGIGGIGTIETQHTILLEKGPRRVSPFLIPMLITNILPGEIAIEYGIKGKNFATTSACASSNHAIGEALRAIRYGDLDVVITGGAESAVTPLAISGFTSIKALSSRNDDPKKASRPFDKERDGFVMGEGAAVLVLESLEHAEKRGAKIYAELKGYGATDDAYHITAPDPEGSAGIRCVQNALADAEVDISEVDYINAHGTSTGLNDASETNIFKKVFGEKAYKIPLSSTKSMTGHLLGAAGAAELIACIMTLKTGIIHPTINYEFPDPECDLDYVPNTRRENQNVKIAISNSLGFGGHNSTLVVKKI